MACLRGPFQKKEIIRGEGTRIRNISNGSKKSPSQFFNVTARNKLKLKEPQNMLAHYQKLPKPQNIRHYQQQNQKNFTIFRKRVAQTLAILFLQSSTLLPRGWQKLVLQSINIVLKEKDFIKKYTQMQDDFNITLYGSICILQSKSPPL